MKKLMAACLCLALLATGCVGSADARLRAEISAAEDAWDIYDLASRPALGMDEEDIKARAEVRLKLKEFFKKAGEVK